MGYPEVRGSALSPEVVSLKFGDLVSTCHHVVQTHQYSQTQLHNSKYQAPAQVQRCSLHAEIAVLLVKAC